jgi:hypothetical protein
MPTNREAFRFFLANAGYASPPGRAACGKMLADAEQWAKDNGLETLWEPEPEPDLSWMSDAERKREHDIEMARIVRECPRHGMKCQHAETLASLGNIVDADGNYRRVIEAELALEAFANGRDLPKPDHCDHCQERFHDDDLGEVVWERRSLIVCESCERFYKANGRFSKDSER